MKIPPLPHTTKKQQEIFYLLYRYRFLSTRHFQKFLNHKDPRRIQKWLKQLVENDYLISYYNPTTIKGKATPAVYCLNTKARHVLKNNDECDPLILRELYKEKTRSEKFREHCLLLADFYFFSLEQAKKNSDTLHFSTKVDLVGYEHFPHPLPDGYIALLKKGKKRRRYFIDIIDSHTPWFAINARVQQYMTYFEEGHWQENPLPLILFICSDTRSVRYLKKAVKAALEQSYETGISFYYTTRAKIRLNDHTVSIWQKVEISNDY